MVTVDSPTAPNAPSVFAATARLSQSEGPLSPALAPLSAASSLTAWDTCSVDELLREASGFGPAMLHLPPWIENKSSGKMMTASTLFFSGKLPATIPTVLGKVMPWNCRPELLTAVREPFHPAFNGEVKSAMSAGDKGGRLRMLDELATHCMLGMLASFFRGVPAGAQRFFSEPPYAFGLAAFPHVGYLLAVEWVGTLHVTVVSEPFFLGSPSHAAAIARLPDCDMSSGYVELVVDRLNVGTSPPELGTRPRVLWRTEPPPQAAGPPAPDGRGADFFKILDGDGFDAPYFRRLHAVYAQLAAARADAVDPPPDALIPAQLLYGAAAVCVLSPWVHGRDGSFDDVAAGGCAVVPVARAIAWLARHGLLYVDLREPNIRVGDGDGGAPPRVALIDYDDMVIIQPPASSAGLCDLLREHTAHFAATDGPGSRPAVVQALHAEWEWRREHVA
jgi:hypothetical protein